MATRTKKEANLMTQKQVRKIKTIMVEIAWNLGNQKLDGVIWFEQIRDEINNI